MGRFDTWSRWPTWSPVNLSTSRHHLSSQDVVVEENTPSVEMNYCPHTIWKRAKNLRFQERGGYFVEWFETLSVIAVFCEQQRRGPWGLRPCCRLFYFIKRSFRCLDPISAYDDITCHNQKWVPMIKVHRVGGVSNLYPQAGHFTGVFSAPCRVAQAERENASTVTSKNENKFFILYRLSSWIGDCEV